MSNTLAELYADSPKQKREKRKTSNNSSTRNSLNEYREVSTLLPARRQQSIYDREMGVAAMQSSQSKPITPLSDEMLRYGSAIKEHEARAEKGEEEKQAFTDWLIITFGIGGCFRERRDELKRKIGMAKARDIVRKSMPLAVWDESDKKNRYEQSERYLSKCMERVALMKRDERKGMKVLAREKSELLNDMAVAYRNKERMFNKYKMAMGARRALEMSFEVFEDDEPSQVMYSALEDLEEVIQFIPDRNLDREDDKMMNVRERLHEMVSNVEESNYMMNDFIADDFQDREGVLENGFQQLLQECDTMFEEEELKEDEENEMKLTTLMPEVKKKTTHHHHHSAEEDSDSGSDSGHSKPGDTPVLAQEDIKREEVLAAESIL